MDRQISPGRETREKVIEMVIDGFLDLHAFQPAEIKSLIPDYRCECQPRGIVQIQIVHGKGSGSLRNLVHKVLDRLPMVKSYEYAPEGNWGVTPRFGASHRIRVTSVVLFPVA